MDEITVMNGHGHTAVKGVKLHNKFLASHLPVVCSMFSTLIGSQPYGSHQKIPTR